jgi:hypothetical protein
MKSHAPALLSFAAALAACSTPAPVAGLSFNAQQLSGWWSDSASTSQACTKENPRIRYQFDPDGKRVTLLFDRKWDTEIGESDKFGAIVLSSTERTLVIQYDNESRKDDAGKLIQWELVIVAPGVYRWRATAWPPGAVNVVVGVRCSA